MGKRIVSAYLFISFFFVSLVKAYSIAPVDTTIRHDVTLGYTRAMLSPYNIWEKESWKVDTNLNNLEHYTTHYSLGNPGLPYVPVIFNTAPAPLGFYYGPDYLSGYFKNDESLMYYNTRAPYLNFFYVTDPQIHQFLDLILTQNFGKKLNVAIGFKRVRSEGIYLLLFDGIYNSSKIQQNGGLQNDSYFTNPNFTSQQRTSDPVNLFSARTTERQTSMRVQQFFFFGFGGSDTIKENPLMYVSHTMRLSGNSNIYSDYTIANDSSGFYPHFYHDVDSTYDSLRYNQFVNDFSIGSAKGWNTILKWDAGVQDQWVHFMDYSATKVHRSGIIDTNIRVMYRDSVFSNLMFHARVYNTYANGHILFDAEGSDIFQGMQHGDMQGSAHLGLKPDSLRLLKLSLDYSLQTPALIYDLYDGNNYQWLNHFSKITTTTASLVYEDAKWHLSIGGSVTQILNDVYFSPAALGTIPAQTQDPITVYKVFIAKDFRVGKWHLDTKEIMQSVTPNEPIHLPNLVAENSLYYQNYLFQHHLLLRVGVDVFYNTAYYVYGYQPVFSQYYVQNDVKMGNYFYFDPFVSFRIKTFRMFLKMENVTSSFLQTNKFYGYALHYPMPDQVLRFGISWDFWN